MISSSTALPSTSDLSPRPYAACISGDICRQPSTPLSFSLLHSTGWVAYFSSFSTPNSSARSLDFDLERPSPLARLLLSASESCALTELSTIPRPQWTFSEWHVTQCHSSFIASFAISHEATSGRPERLSTLAGSHFFALLLFPPYEPPSPQSSFSCHRWLLQQHETDVFAYDWLLQRFPRGRC